MICDGNSTLVRKVTRNGQSNLCVLVFLWNFKEISVSEVKHNEVWKLLEVEKARAAEVLEQWKGRVDRESWGRWTGMTWKGLPWASYCKVPFPDGWDLSIPNPFWDFRWGVLINLFVISTLLALLFLPTSSCQWHLPSDCLVLLHHVWDVMFLMGQWKMLASRVWKLSLFLPAAAICSFVWKWLKGTQMSVIF